MSWNYDPALSTTKDLVRLYIGDINTSSQLFPDETINALLNINSNPLYVAYQLCDSLASQYASLVDVSVESVRESASQKHTQYKAMADSLKAQAKSASSCLGVPIVGGVSVSEMKTVASNTDRVTPAFQEGQFDNPPYTDSINLKVQ